MARTPPDVIERYKEELGLNLPIWQQYLHYMSGVLRGDFGTSLFDRRPVIDLIAEAAMYTVVLALAAFLFPLLDVPMVQGMLRGMGAVSAGLIAGSALKLTRGLDGHPFRATGCVALTGLTLAGAAVLHVPLVWLLVGLGIPGTLLAWRMLWLQTRAERTAAGAL